MVLTLFQSHFYKGVFMFTRMDEGSQEDWEHIGAENLPHIVDMPNRVIGMLEQLESFLIERHGISCESAALLVYRSALTIPKNVNTMFRFL
jgi:hypothetical protein